MSNWSPETIVLIDDNKVDNRCHKRVIVRSGFAGTVLTFPMAEDALEYMRSDGALPIDLILLDINMPRMDGFELLSEAESEFGEAFQPSIVVMLTTSLDPRDEVRASEVPFISGYMMKPLTEEKFHEILENVGRVRVGVA